MRLSDLLFQVKRPLRRALYEAMDRLLLHRPAPGDGRDILVIKLDVLGDYLLFRPFLKPLKAQALAQGGKLMLAANTAVAALARALDGDVVDEFIFLDARGRFLSSPAYRYSILQQFRRRFAAVYHPTAKRIFENESLVRLAHSPSKIGIAWQNRFQRTKAETNSDRWYTRLIEVPSFGMFEFDRENAFFAGAIGVSLPPSALRITPEPELPKGLQVPYALLFPGAGFAIREWPVERFAALARHLKERYGLTVAVAGAPGDRAKGERIAAETGAVNRCGGIALAELPLLVARARVVVANESGPVHLAACVGTPVLCLSNGNHFGWWNPYPESYGFPVLTLYPDEIDRGMADPGELYRRFGTASTLPMSLITAEKALAGLDLLMEVSFSDKIR